MAEARLNFVIKVDGAAAIPTTTEAVEKLGQSASSTLVSMSGFNGVASQMALSLGPAGFAAMGVGIGITALAAAASSAIGILKQLGEATFSAMEQAGKYAEDTLNLSAQLGITTDEVQKLSRGVKVAGGDFGAAASSINKMQKALAEGSDVFDRLGLSAAKLARMPVNAALAEVVERIDAIREPTLKAAAEMEVLSKTGAESFEKLRAGLGMMGEFKGLPDSALASAAAMDDALDKLGIAWKDLILQYGAAVASSPELKEAISSITEVLTSAGDWISEHKNLFRLMADMFVGWTKSAVSGLQEVWGWAQKLGPALTKIADTLSGGAFSRVSGGFMADFKKAAGDQAGLDLSSSSKKWTTPTSFKGKADAEAMKKAADEADKLAAELAKVVIEEHKIEESKAAAEMEKFWTILAKLGPTVGSVAEEQETLNESLRLAGGMAGASTPQLKSYIEQIEKLIKTGQAGADAQTALENALDELSNRGVASIGDFPGEFKKAQSATEKWRDALSDAQAVMGGLSQIMDAFGVSSDSAAGKVLKLAQGLAGAGEKFLSGDVVGGIAQAAGSIASAVAGMFGPDWAKAARNASKQLGTDVSEDLAKAIAQTAKEKHISTGAATMLHLTDAMAESGKDARSFAPQVQNLLRDIKSGAIPAKEGLEQVAGAFSSIRAAAQAAGTVGDKAMVSIIQQARASGQVVPEITAAVKESLGQAVSGVGALTKGIPIVSAEDAKAQAYILSATFWGKVKEDGLIQAGTALQPAFQQMQESMSKAGIDPSVVASILGPIQGVMSLLSNEATKGIAEGIGGLQDALKGLADSGYMTQGAFQGIQQQASSAFSQLTASGVDSTTALQAIAPLLSQLQSASQQYGLQLDTNTQSLIDQANAAGIAFPTDPMQKVVDLLSSIATALGAEIPASAQVTANAMSSSASNTSTALSQMSSNTVTSTDKMLSAVTQTVAAGGETMVATWSDKTQAMQGIFGDSTSTITELAGMSADKVSSTFDSMGSSMKATFESAIDTSTDKMAALADSAFALTDGLGGVKDAALLAGQAFQTMRIPSGFDLNVQGFQHGGFVPETYPHGALVRVAEPGTGGEHMIPGRKAGGGGSGAGTLHVHLHLDGKELDSFIVEGVTRDRNGLWQAIKRGPRAG